MRKRSFVLTGCDHRRRPRVVNRATRRVALGLIAAALIAATASCAAGAAGAADTRLPQGSERYPLAPRDFTTVIDNPYWPMRPGTRWTYRETDEHQESVDVVVVVTTRTKRVANGITARVVRDTVTRDGAVIEDTFDWYAQDRAGNVWYLGEDTAEFDNGTITSREGSWEAGVKGAQAGVMIPAAPRPGLHYRQEFLAGTAEDSGRVLSTDEMAQVPWGHFRGVLLTRDSSRIEPNVLEYKLYARGVGPVLTLDVSGGGGREQLITVDRAPPSAGTGPLGLPNP